MTAIAPQRDQSLKTTFSAQGTVGTFTIEKKISLWQGAVRGEIATLIALIVAVVSIAFASILTGHLVFAMPIIGPILSCLGAFSNMQKLVGIFLLIFGGAAAGATATYVFEPIVVHSHVVTIDSNSRNSVNNALRLALLCEWIHNKITDQDLRDYAMILESFDHIPSSTPAGVATSIAADT